MGLERKRFDGDKRGSGMKERWPANHARGEGRPDGRRVRILSGSSPSANRRRVRVTARGEGKTHAVDGVIIGVRNSVRESEEKERPGRSGPREIEPAIQGGRAWSGGDHESLEI